MILRVFALAVLFVLVSLNPAVAAAPAVVKPPVPVLPTAPVVPSVTVPVPPSVGTPAIIDIEKSAPDTGVPSHDDLTLVFEGSQAELDAKAQAKLDRVIVEMVAATHKLQVYAYASGEEGSKADAKRVALARGLAVRSYLMDHGIIAERVIVKSMGAETDQTPVDRIDLIFAK